MVNTEDFIKRLEIILEYYTLNASAFADKIGVQRSSLSHLLSGRNKPSLDFILKIMDVFPEVDLYWILNGKGTFPKSELEVETNITSSPPIVHPKVAPIKIETPPDLFTEKKSDGRNPMEENLSNIFSHSKITSNQITGMEMDRIVIFYKNGTFKTYSPE